MFDDLGNNLLTVLIMLPLLGAVITAFLPKDPPALARWVALIASLLPMVLGIWLFYEMSTTDPDANGYYYEFTAEWFPEIGASWHVGIDGISGSMVLLTVLLTPLAVLIAWEHDMNPRAVLALILMLEMAMLGVFMARDMLLFFVFWELGLVPMYFLINQWGGENRGYASMKFFIYTMAGSLGLLLSIQMIAFSVGAELGTGPVFDLDTWYRVWPNLDIDDVIGFNTGTLKYFAFLSFFIAFAIKIPVWPFHTWLPDAHTEAPTAGSMLLAGVLLKQGAYGFVRFVIPLFPQTFAQKTQFGLPDIIPIDMGFEFRFTTLLAILAMLGIVLGALAAWAQDDLKKLVAYSSVNHMGFVVIGLAAAGVMYGTIWASSPEIDDPVMALGMIDKSLVNADIDTYREDAGLSLSVATSLDDLTADEQKALARVKLAEYAPDIAKNTQNANVALNGAVLQMFNHGLSSAAMFLLVGALYHKAHTRDLRRFGGLWHIIPVYSAVFVFTSMASLGLPGLNGFTSEWLVVSGAFPIFPVLMLLSMLGLLMTGAYILKGIQKVLHGPANPEWIEYHNHQHSLEINVREFVAIAPLLVLMLVTGLYPNWILRVIDSSVTDMFTKLIGG